MKYFILTLFLTCLIGKSFAQPRDGELDQNELLRKNGIKKLMKFESRSIDGNIKDSVLKESCLYQYVNGFFSKQEFYDDKQKLRFQYTFLYNKNNQIAIMISELGGPITPATSFIEATTLYQYEYDSLGREIRVYDFNKDTTRLKVETKLYDKLGRLIQIKTKINNNKEFISRKYYYYPSGELEREEAFFQDKKRPAYSNTHIYDKIANKESIVIENDSGKELEEEIFYNDKKQQIWKVRPVKSPMDSNKTHYNTTEYRYYQNGLLYERKRGITIERFYYFSD
jgi:hypothetical protein